jgi:hypothetical protein
MAYNPISPPPGRDQLMRPPYLPTTYPFIPLEHNKQKATQKEANPSSHPAIEEEPSRRCLCCFFFPVPAGRPAFGLEKPAPPANEDIDAHTPVPGYIDPSWDTANRPVPHLLPPLPFPSLPLHLLPSLFRLTTGRFRCRRGRLVRFGHDARARPGMIGVHVWSACCA